MKNRIVDRVFPVNGMSCAVCAGSVETTLNQAEGVVLAKVNFANNTVLIKYDPSLTNPETLKEKLKKIDFELVVEDKDANLISDEMALKKVANFKKRFWVALIFTIPVFVLSMFVMDHGIWTNYLLFILSLPVVLWSGNSFFVGAWRQMLQRKANMDTLVALSSGIAFLFSCVIVFFHDVLHDLNLPDHTWFESATVIITFVLLGKFLEEKSKRKASETIRRLIQLQPRVVLVQRNGTEYETDVELLIPGDIVILKPGQIVPVDGRVDSGNSYVDESTITGESVPVYKNEGAKVFAGTLNQNGLLFLKVTTLSSETLIAKIIKMVEEAQSSKAPIQKLVDKIAMIFVPLILMIAFLTFVLWIWFGPEGQSLSMALLNSLTVLVIACPCALGLATPTALIAGVGRGAESGILIRDAEALEQVYKTQIIVFDKTGTLTKGKPKVMESFLVDEPNLVNSIYSIESKSDHPYARAICAFLEDRKSEILEVSDFNNIQGIGIQASVSGTDYVIASYKHFLQRDVQKDVPLIEEMNFLKTHGALSLIVVLANNKLIAWFGLMDEIREESHAAIDALKKMKIHTVLLSGDNERVVADVAAKCGIDEFYSSVMPDKKGEVIARLQAENRVVAMVGDGINDSHALAKADVGIAMGNGSDIAIEAASITLTNSNLNNVPAAIQLSKFTIRIIQQNLFWAFIYNIIAVPIAAGILYPINGMLLNPMIAGAAMALSSVSVVLNSLRLKRMNISHN